MRFFKINAALLALIFSMIAEVVFFFVVRALGNFSEFGTPLNFIAWFGYWFHILPCVYLRELGESPLALPAWLFQWWLIFFVGIISIRHISSQDNPKVLRKIIAVLMIALIASLAFLVHSQFWQDSNWKTQVNSLARFQGYEQAKEDFQAGKLKKLVVSGDREEDRFSGSNDGPFEVWNPIYMSSWPYPDRYSVEMEVVGYNMGMRSKYEWSLTHTNNVKSNR